MMEKPNLSYIKELSGDDHEFEMDFINILKAEFPVEKLQFEQYMINKDFYNAHQTVHKLKHKLNVLGLTKGYEIAVEFEEQLKKEEINLHRTFNEILISIETYLKTK